MQPRSLHHVAMWLEDGPSAESVFHQGLDWAFRLNLPLRAIVHSARGQKSTSGDGAPVVEKMKAWGLACTQRGVALETVQSLDGDAGMNQFLRPHGLCVFVDNPCSLPQDALLRRAAQIQENALLLCPSHDSPLNRFLVLFDQKAPNAAFLESAVRFSQAMEIHPIILIVARTESEAHLRQGYAEGVCNAFKLAADFDSVVGCDLRSAISRVALWRNCSHLIVQRQPTSSWWGRSSATGLEPFRALASSLSVLALPEAMVLDVPRIIRNDCASLLGKTNTLQSRDTVKPQVYSEVRRG